MTTGTTTETLNDTDRKLILFVHGYRRQRDAGPTWREITEAVGLLPVSLASKRFQDWWDDGGWEELERRRPLQNFRARHPELDAEAAQRRWRRQAHSQWVRQQMYNDPLAVRLRRLADLGYVTFSREERSLNIGPRVREWQQANHSPSLRTPTLPVRTNSLAFGQLGAADQVPVAGTWHVLKWEGMDGPRSARRGGRDRVCGL